MKIPLTEHVKTLANREELVGLKVWDNLNDKYVTISSKPTFDSNYLYCTWDKLTLPRHINSLSIDLTEQEHV